jgi:hypothetical protein
MVEADNVQERLGLPRLTDMNEVHSLIALQSSTGDLSSSEDEGSYDGSSMYSSLSSHSPVAMDHNSSSSPFLLSDPESPPPHLYYSDQGSSSSREMLSSEHAVNSPMSRLNSSMTSPRSLTSPRSEVASLRSHQDLDSSSLDSDSQHSSDQRNSFEFNPSSPVSQQGKSSPYIFQQKNGPLSPPMYELETPASPPISDQGRNSPYLFQQDSPTTSYDLESPSSPLMSDQGIPSSSPDVSPPLTRHEAARISEQNSIQTRARVSDPKRRKLDI